MFVPETLGAGVEPRGRRRRAEQVVFNVIFNYTQRLKAYSVSRQAEGRKKKSNKTLDPKIRQLNKNT